MRILIAIVCIICLIGIGCSQPVFESSGSVRGIGYGQVYQYNPYQGMYYDFGNMYYPYNYQYNVYWSNSPFYYYWNVWR